MLNPKGNFQEFTALQVPPKGAAGLTSPGFAPQPQLFPRQEILQLFPSLLLCFSSPHTLAFPGLECGTPGLFG